jgi:hypothetical protein
MTEDRNDQPFVTKHGAMNLQANGGKPAMFKILELKGGGSAPATEVGRGYLSREQAMAAVKTHLKTFKASGHNPEGDYWWARDAEGLRKCWIASAD